MGEEVSPPFNNDDITW